LRKVGLVIAVEQDDVVVRSQRESSCGSCAGKASCGTLGSWSSHGKDKNDYDIRLPNTLQAKEGDMVVVEVPDRLILTASIIFYGYPVLAFLVAGGLSFSFAEGLGLSGDMFSAMGGLLGAGLTWVWLLKRTRITQMPEMVEIQQ